MQTRITNLIRRILFEERLLVSAIVVGLLFTTYSFVGCRILPGGINQVFAQRSLQLFMLPTILLVCLFLICYVLRAVQTPLIKNFDRLDRTDWLILLLPLTPITRYAILNFDSLTSLALAVFFLMAVVLSVCVVVLVPLAFSVIASKRIVALASGAYLFLLFDMASLAGKYSWHLEGGLKIQMFILIGTMVVMMALFFLSKKMLGVMLISYFVLSAVGPVLGGEKSILMFADQQSDTQKSTMALFDSAGIEHKRDVIFLVYESYVNQETMKHYGYDNSDQIRYLKGLGFTVYEHNYTLAANSLGSMSRALNISTEIENMRSHTSGNSLVPNILRRNSYVTAGVFSSSYFFRGSNPVWDHYFPSGERVFNIFEAVMEGEFRFDFRFDSFEYDDYLKEKRRIIRDQSIAPLFIYTHNKYPGHTQNSGRCMPHERQQYFDNIEIANNEMRADLEAVFLARRDAIVIIAGDHGPYQTKNCRGLSAFNQEEITRYDIQDRYGSFLAIKWPETVYNSYEIRTLQDVFPAVLSTLFNEPRMWEQGRTGSSTVGNAAGQGIYVENGIVHGGANDGDRLFEGLD